jgi:hypothetical protein
MQKAEELDPSRTKGILIKSNFEGDGLQAVRKYHKIIAALAAEGLRRELIRIVLKHPADIRLILWATSRTQSATNFLTWGGSLYETTTAADQRNSTRRRVGDFCR